MAGEGHAYSTLEAVHPGYQPDRQENPLPSDAGKQVVPDYGKQLAINNEGIEVVAKDGSFAQEVGGYHVPAPRASRRRWLIFGGVIALVIILAAVIGGVFGSRKSSHSATASTTPTSSPPSNSSATIIPVQRNIVAISYSSNSVNNTRVYYQDDLGQLMESANSGNNVSWSSGGTGTFGMNGSAIAAAVSRPNFPLASLLSRNRLPCGNYPTGG
jgi:hypothetical protein